MKIIGRMKGAYIVTMSSDEIARIAGYSSAWGDFEKAMRALGTWQDGWLVEGSEVPVSDLWRRLDGLRHHENEVKKAAASLRGLADLMDGALPSIVAPVPAGEDADRRVPRQGDAA